jgi:predicted enzyme related to lactoylglutathione lyase
MDTTTLETTKSAPASKTTLPVTTTTASTAHTTTTPATAETKKKKIKKSAQVKKVGYFIHYVPDMAKAVTFFQSIGLKLKFESPEWTEFKAGIKFALHSSDCAAKACSSEKAEKRFTGITFSSKNLDKTYAAFKEQGITIMSEPRQVCEEGRSFEFSDPFGAVFSIYGK